MRARVRVNDPPAVRIAVTVGAVPVGTEGTRLRTNSTDGTSQQTWTNTYGQHVELTGQTLNAGDVLTLYATSGSSSRYCWVSNLIIEQTA